jgi:hypothetical protein
VLIAYGDRDASILKSCGIDGQFVALGNLAAIDTFLTHLDSGGDAKPNPPKA